MKFLQNVRVLALVLGCLLFLSSSSVWANDPLLEDLEEIDQALQSGDLPALQGNLEKLVQKKTHNPWVYYYLGQVSDQNNQLAKARLYYEKAISLSPREAMFHQGYGDLLKKMNLEHELKPTWQERVFFTATFLNHFEYQMLLVIMMFVLLLVLFVYFLKPKKMLKRGGIVLFLVYLHLTFGYFYFTRHQTAIVSDQTSLREFYLETSPTFAVLPLGSRVQILEQQSFNSDNSWIKVKTYDNQQGWVLQKELLFFQAD